MNSRSFRLSPTLFAFTLIELLTVITIIAILMGLLFPVIGIVKDHVRKAEARAAATQIAAAVKHYSTDYGKYPTADYVNANSPADLKLGDRTSAGATDSNADLFNILRSRNVGRNADNVYNPRRTTYFEGKPAGDSQAPKSGFLETAGGTGTVGAFYDPWGREYNIVIDANYNGVINLAGTYKDFVNQSQDGADTGVQVGVGVFSLGKDGMVGSPNNGVTGAYRSGSQVSDDIVSWQ